MGAGTTGAKVSGALGALVLAAALTWLAACADEGAGAGATAGSGGDTGGAVLAGIYVGTRTEGPPSVTFPLAPEARALPAGDLGPASFDPGGRVDTRAAHWSNGVLALIFTANADGSTAGSIAIDADICWTAFVGHLPEQETQTAPLAISIDAAAGKVVFEYASPLVAGSLVRLVAPYPPNVSWSGSYDGSLGLTGEPGEANWVGNFTVDKQ